jgi:hypothetical protein
MRTGSILRLSCLILLLTLTVGCQSKNAGKLEGTSWRSEPTTYKGQRVPEGFLKLDFGKDGTIVYRAGPYTFHGKYILGMGNRVTFELDKPLAGKTTHHETVEVRLGQIIVKDSDGTTVNFRKN